MLILINIVLIMFLIKAFSFQKQIANSNSQTQKEKSTISSETEEILNAVQNYAQSHSAPEQEFTVKLISKVKKGRDEYALVHVNPVPIDSAEPAGAVLQKIGGLWIVMDFGTLLMEWHQRVPELFNF